MLGGGHAVWYGMGDRGALWCRQIAQQRLSGGWGSRLRSRERRRGGKSATDAREVWCAVEFSQRAIQSGLVLLIASSEPRCDGVLEDPKGAVDTGGGPRRRLEGSGARAARGRGAA